MLGGVHCRLNHEHSTTTNHHHLPFTFNRQGRVGILAFFDRKLLDHGEGGSGRFFSNQPKFFVAPEEHTLVDKT